MAVLKAGRAYVPLDPSYPADRLAFILKDSAPFTLLTQRELKAHWSNLAEHVSVIEIDAANRPWEQLSASNPDSCELGLAAAHLAYVIHTSGSTGKPKGVMNEHRGVVNRLLWMQDAYGMVGRDAVLQKTPFSSDVSVWEFFWTLSTGARLVMAKPEGHKDPDYLTRVICQAGISTVHFVPSMLQVFLEHPGAARCGSLTRVVCRGKALSAGLAARLHECLPHTALYNLYGPREATVDVTAWPSRPGYTGACTPIGKPIVNTRIYVLDGHQQPLPLGVAGELYIGGIQVARGYLNRSELTAERFLPDPFVKATGQEPSPRMYKTGDLGHFLPDGNIEFLGRNDFLVKIRGFRIELGEIQARLAAMDDIERIVQTAPGGASQYPGHLSAKRCQAHLAGVQDGPPEPPAYRNFVAQTRLGVRRDEHEAFFSRMLGDVDEPTALFGLTGETEFSLQKQLPTAAKTADLETFVKICKKKQLFSRHMSMEALGQYLARMKGAVHALDDYHPSHIAILADWLRQGLATGAKPNIELRNIEVYA